MRVNLLKLLIELSYEISSWFLIFNNKRVLVRADFNVPLGSDNKVDNKEDWRIQSTLPTIKYLLEQEAKIIIFVSSRKA